MPIAILSHFGPFEEGQEGQEGKARGKELLSRARLIDDLCEFISVQ